MKTSCTAMKTSFNVESYMNDQQLMYFRNRLICQKAEMINRITTVKEKIRTLKEHPADILDRSNHTVGIEQEFQNCERYSQIIRQIDEALERIGNGSFGYCEYTGYPIGLDRLEVVPFASLSIEALRELEAGSH